MGLSSIVDRLTAHSWTGAEIDALVGETRESCVAHAADDEVRGAAASGGAVTALLIAQLESGSIDGALVCVTSVEDGLVRARYRIARTRDEVLAARGSTYVLGEFAREAMPMIRAFPGRLAVVALPCEIALLRHDAAVGDQVALAISLFCGHTTETTLVDALVRKLTAQAGGATLTKFRFRTGHWRGRLIAEFDDGTVIDRPAAYYLLYHNLYFGSPKKCIFCGDHFGYGADICAGDLWIQKYKNDPIKHTALIVKTERGVRALAAARDAGLLASTAVPVAEILDGQRRTAPFHYNVTARSRVAAGRGIKIPDRVSTMVHWHDRLAAGMALRSYLATRDVEGCEKVLGRNRRLLKLRLYWLKGLESLPTGPLVPGSVDGSPRFSFIAATVSGNRGAEAMLETSIGRIRDRFPDARFTVFSYYPEKDSALIRDAAVSVRSSTPVYLVLVLFPLSLLAAPFARVLGRVPRFFSRSVRELGESAALVDLAGVSFIDGREKFLPFNMLTILPAMLLGTPVFKLAQAMGPFKKPVNRFAARILRRCAMVVARGDVTLSHMETISFPADRLLAAPDIAFLFEARDALSSEGAAEAEELASRARALREAGSAVVGLCPSAVLAGKAKEEGWDYLGFLATLASGLIKDGHSVLLFPNATRAGSAKLRNNDLPVIAEIAERLAGQEAANVLAVRGDMNAAELRVVLAECSVAAVSRFHAMVGALSIGVPVAVVGWSHKYLEVMKQFGLDEFVFDYSAHDPEALRAVVGRLIAERDARAADIVTRLPSVQADSRGQFDAMFRRLGI
jgi:coenzyme F420-reducing hydrogenase beta subunit/polysaccharide pyruvyl transferase WcaK-like protein